MKSSLLRLLLAAAALAAMPPAASAQPRARRPSPPRPGFPAPSAAHNGVITADVYEDSNPARTLLTLQSMSLESTATQQASFSLAYSYTANPYSVAGGGVRLVLQRRGPQCLLQPNSAILITLGNGVPVKYENPAVAGFGVNWVHSEMDENGACVESISATLLPKNFARLATGKPRRVSFGAAQFAFTLSHTNAMLAFNERITRAPN